MEDIASAAAAAPATPKLRPTVEDQAIYNYIEESGHLLERIRLSTAVNERLVDYGFEDDDLAIGMGMQEAALANLCERLTAGGVSLDQYAAELNAAAKAARDKYTDFRGIARAAFPGLSDRVNLRVVGELPDDLQRFINVAYTAYEAAGQPPYAEKLIKRGYTAAKLQALNDELDKLAKLGVEADEDTETEEKSAAPNEAYDALREFMKELKGVLRTAFRKETDVLQDLEL